MNNFKKVIITNRTNFETIVGEINRIITKPTELDLGSGYVMKSKALSVVINTILFIFLCTMYVFCVLGIVTEIVGTLLTAATVFVLMAVQAMLGFLALAIVLPFSNQNGVTKLGKKLGVKK